MLNPCEVGVSCRRNTVLPAGIVAQLVATPVAVVERRICHHEVGLHIAVGIVEERTFGVPLHLRSIDATDGKVHLAQSPGGLVAFLPVNRNVFNPALMLLHKLFALHKHSARTAAWVEHTTFVRLQHIHKQFNDTSRRIELSAFLAFGQSELAEEILEHMSKQVGALGACVLQGRIANQVNKFAQTGRVEVGTGKHLGQNAFQRLVLAFDGIHCIVDVFADLRTLSHRNQMRPTRIGWHIENILGCILIAVFGVCTIRLLFHELCVQLFKRNGNVSQENQSQYNMLIFSRINIFAQFVSRFPKLFFKRFFCSLFCIRHNLKYV